MPPVLHELPVVASHHQATRLVEGDEFVRVLGHIPHELLHTAHKFHRTLRFVVLHLVDVSVIPSVAHRDGHGVRIAV